MTQPGSVERLRELLARATPGPWYASDWTQDDGDEPFTIEAREPEILSPGQSSIWPDGIQKIRVADTVDGERPREDAALIVEAVNALPDLLTLIEHLQADIEEARRGLQALAPDALKVLNALGDGEYVLPASYVAADIGVPEKRVREVYRALRTLGLADFGPLTREDDNAQVGSGYWISSRGLDLCAAACTFLDKQNNA